MKKRSLAGLLAMSLAASVVSHAQTLPQQPELLDLMAVPPGLVVQPHAELRLRGQLDANRDLKASADPRLVLPLWSVASLQLEGGDVISARLALGLRGRLGRPEAMVPMLDEAFIEARLPWSQGLLRIRAGRQAIRFADPRLISEQVFLDRPERVDAVRLTAGADLIEVDAVVVMLQGDARTRAGGAEILALSTLSTFWGEQLEAHLELAGLLGSALSEVDDPRVEGDQRAEMQVAQLGFGLILRPIEGVTAQTALSWQTGRSRNLDVSAFDLSTRLRLQAPVQPIPSIVIGLDHSSGEGQRFDNRQTRFLSPLGERHDRFGAADLLAPENASDLFVKLSIEQDASRLDLSLHRLGLAESSDRWVEVGGLDHGIGNTSERMLGHEIDVEAVLPVLSPLQLEFLYSLFLPDRAAGSRAGWQATHRLLVGLSASL